MENLELALLSQHFLSIKHDAYNMSDSQVDLKLTNFALLDAHTLPTHGSAWRGDGLPSMCVCHIITKNKKRNRKSLIPSAYM
jgi:hypothetical protein